MDYSKLSDFEINNRVLALNSEIKPLAYHHNADERSAGIVDINADYHWFDFCNKPADAWPIIFNNGIGLRKQSNGIWSCSQPGGKYPQYSEKPLRAAMIVFLMMQGD